MFIDHPLFNKAKNILIQLENEGHEAYFVGGCIRDMILRLRIIHKKCNKSFLNILTLG